MKYIISEARIEKFMKSYLDNFLETKVMYKQDPFIVIEDHYIDDYQASPQYMEHDRTDGRLWVNRKFLEGFCKIFGCSREYGIYFITHWFEDKFDVDVRFLDS